MKKIKKSIILSSLICLTSSSLSLIIGLSSCVLNPNDNKNDGNSNDNIVTPPDNNESDGDEGDNGIDSEKPIEPDVSPEVKPPIDNYPNIPKPPENNPTVPSESDLVNNKGISLKYYKELLPSQYLLNINDLKNFDVDKSKIIENFDKSKILDVKYTILTLDDWIGILSIKMEYKSKADNKLHEFIFNFTNLAKLENKNYSLYFDVENKNLLNAKEISDWSTNNDNDSKSFFEYLNQIGAKLIFKNDANKLTLEYLSFENGIASTGFQKSWYTLNSEIALKIYLKSLKINVYEKKETSNIINIKKVEYPSNLIGGSKNPITLNCASALDFLLEKVTINSTYKEDKFASYYYYDITKNEGLKSQLKLTNNCWLKNVINEINGYADKHYKVVLSKTINPTIDDFGNLTIQIQMQLSDEEVFSRNIKELVVRSFLPINNELFYYGLGSKENKFSLFSDAEDQDKIFEFIKNHKKISEIRDHINNNNNNLVDVSSFFIKTDYLKFQKYIKLYFGNSQIIKDNVYEFYTSIDEKISINNFFMDFNDAILQYDKNSNSFLIKCILIIDCQGISYDSSTSEKMTVNITKIGKPIL